MLTAAIIVAAGRGLRAAEAGAAPKQYRAVAGRTALAHSLRAFLDHDSVDLVQPVIHAEDGELYQRAVSGLASPKLLEPVAGGQTRQQSVLLGLRALKPRDPRDVMIHDAARPFVSADIIARTAAALGERAACLVAVPLSDTLKAEADGRVERTIGRERLWRAQTPQAFRYAAILEAHEAAAAAGREDFTDDAAIAEWRGLEVALVMGSERNLKLTTPEDFEIAERLFGERGAMTETRVGTGFDVHAFEPGDHVTLCGVTIPYPSRLSGHSDADVGLHALTDAILGAVGAGDIGHHFPPSDPAWKGADSSLFLAHAARLLRAAGGRIAHVDVTLICEAPKIGPYREAMRERIAAILEIEKARVSVKATTTEGLGFTGRREGIAGMASATVELSKPAV